VLLVLLLVFWCFAGISVLSSVHNPGHEVLATFAHSATHKILDVTNGQGVDAEASGRRVLEVRSSLFLEAIAWDLTPGCLQNRGLG